MQCLDKISHFMLQPERTNKHFSHVDNHNNSEKSGEFVACKQSIHAEKNQLLPRNICIQSQGCKKNYLNYSNGKAIKLKFP